MRYAFLILVSLCFGLAPTWAQDASEPPPYCVDALVFANFPVPEFPALEFYRPLELPKRDPEELVDDELMMSLEGRPKAFVKAYRWHGTWQTLSQYGMPYRHDGDWYIDFCARGIVPTEERVLWRMPARDFYEGVKAELGGRSFETFLENSTEI